MITQKKNLSKKCLIMSGKICGKNNEPNLKIKGDIKLWTHQNLNKRKKTIIISLYLRHTYKFYMYIFSSVFLNNLEKCW
jgi:hypothetical protein